MNELNINISLGLLLLNDLLRAKVIENDTYDQAVVKLNEPISKPLGAAPSKKRWNET